MAFLAEGYTSPRDGFGYFIVSSQESQLFLGFSIFFTGSAIFSPFFCSKKRIYRLMATFSSSRAFGCLLRLYSSSTARRVLATTSPDLGKQ